MKKLKLLKEGDIYKISSVGEKVELSELDYETIISGLYITKKTNGKFIFEDNVIAIEEKKKQDLIAIKKEKSNQINSIFGETDKLEAVISQINTIAEVLDTITEPVPDTELINDAKSKFAQIKEILNENNI